jgi:hypothetical protein
MSFNYFPNIPFAQNNPSNDQPNMETNTNSISNLISVNHVGFNMTSSGQHLRCDFKGVNPPVGSPTLADSSLFTNTTALGASPTNAGLFFQNANATFHFPIRAWGWIIETGGVNSNQAWNVASAVLISTGLYEITLSTGAVSSVNFAVVGSTKSTEMTNIRTNFNSFPVSWSGGVGVFRVEITTVNNAPTGANAKFSFLVMQI